MGQEQLITHSSHALVGSTNMHQSQNGMGLWEWTGEDGMGMGVDEDCSGNPHYEKPRSVMKINPQTPMFMSQKETEETFYFI